MHKAARTIDPPQQPADAGFPDGGGSGGRSRGGAGHRGGRGGRVRRRRRVLRAMATTLSVLILATAAAGWLYYNHLNDNIRKGERNSGTSDAKKAEPNAAGQTPLNVLLLGSDSRASAANVSLGGSRADKDRKPLADVQMLLHISADRSNASLVSIPRDTRVDIPQCTDPDTGEVFAPVNTIINESLTRGGPGCTLATWENLTDVYIDHWIMVDFAGVVSMADAVGGVEVCVKENIWDRNLSTGRGGSGLKLKAGRQKVEGKQALQWLRTRYAFGSDINRTRAQHMYLNSMVRELRSQNAFTDTGRLMRLAEAGTKALTVDEGLGTVKSLFDLGMQLKGVPSDRITATTMPSDPDPLNPGAHLIPKPGEAQQLFAMMRDDVPFDDKGKGGDGGDKDGAAKKPANGAEPEEAKGPSPSPKGALPITVLNGTGVDGKRPVSGRANAIAGGLADAGFTKAAAGTALTPQQDTTVSYPAGQGDQGKADALAVAKALGIPGSAVTKAPDAQAQTITVVVGGDWPTGTEYVGAEPEEGGVPESANPLSGDDKDACMDVYDPFVW